MGVTTRPWGWPHQAIQKKLQAPSHPHLRKKSTGPSGRKSTGPSSAIHPATKSASQEKEGCGEAGLTCQQEGGALQGQVLLQGAHPEGEVLRGPHLAFGGGQQPPLLDEEVIRAGNCLFKCGFRILKDYIY